MREQHEATALCPLCGVQRGQASAPTDSSHRQCGLSSGPSGGKASQCIRKHLLGAYCIQGLQREKGHDPTRFQEDPLPRAGHGGQGRGWEHQMLHLDQVGQEVARAVGPTQDLLRGWM